MSFELTADDRNALTLRAMGCSAWNRKADDPGIAGSVGIIYGLYRFRSGSTGCGTSSTDRLHVGGRDSGGLG